MNLHQRSKQPRKKVVAGGHSQVPRLPTLPLVVVVRREKRKERERNHGRNLRTRRNLRSKKVATLAHFGEHRHRQEMMLQRMLVKRNPHGLDSEGVAVVAVGEPVVRVLAAVIVVAVSALASFSFSFPLPCFLAGGSTGGNVGRQIGGCVGLVTGAIVGAGSSTGATASTAADVGAAANGLLLPTTAFDSAATSPELTAAAEAEAEAEVEVEVARLWPLTI